MTAVRFAHFSNSVLEGPLRFLERYQDSQRIQIFLKDLGVTEEWIRDVKNWHDSGFHLRFYETALKSFPDYKDIAFEGTRALYTDSKFQQFTSLAGLLLTPERLFGFLPKVSMRMNSYNGYEFRLSFRRVAFSGGALIQTYQDRSARALNGFLCDACRGSITGVMAFMGYRILDLHESRCVKRGDESCVYEINWLNRPLLKQLVAWLGGTAALSLVVSRLTDVSSVSGVLGSALASCLTLAVFSIRRQRESLRAAFEYQDAVLKELRQAAEARELMNRKLIQFQGELSEAMTLASIGEASFSMVHDMASPTTLIRMYASLLGQTIKGKFPDDSEFLHYCNAIDRATQSLVKLQILFRNRTSQQDSSVVVRQDLRQLVSGFLDLFDPLTQKQKISASVQGGTDPVEIEAYEGSIESIFLNLIQNAINAMSNTPRGSLTITIEQDQDNARIRVADSGPGIPPERMAHLWERFGVSSGGRREGFTPALRGTGFGLYNIKKIVDRLGGMISVQSSPTGTAFDFVLPKRIIKRYPLPF